MIVLPDKPNCGTIAVIESPARKSIVEVDEHFHALNPDEKRSIVRQVARWIGAVRDEITAAEHS